MVSRVIHLGQDTCHRLAVLEHAGYHVEACASIPELQQALAEQDELDAVVISEGADGAHLDAVLLARAQTSAPVILFRDTQRTFTESSFDLVVPILVPPETWLVDMAAVIARSQAVQASSPGLRQQFAEVRHSSAPLRAISEGKRQTAGAQYQKFPQARWAGGRPRQRQINLALAGFAEHRPTIFHRTTLPVEPISLSPRLL